MKWSGWTFAMPGGDHSGPTSRFFLRLLRQSLRAKEHADVWLNETNQINKTNQTNQTNQMNQTNQILCI